MSSAFNSEIFQIDKILLKIVNYWWCFTVFVAASVVMYVYSAVAAMRPCKEGAFNCLSDENPSLLML